MLLAHAEWMWWIMIVPAIIWAAILICLLVVVGKELWAWLTRT